MEGSSPCRSDVATATAASSTTQALTTGPGAENAPRFAMDYSMHKIAKYLRLLGYDTLCDHRVTQDQIISRAASEHRCLVSCSGSLLKQVAAHNRAVRKRQAAAAPPPQHHVVAYDSDGDSVYSTSSELTEAEIVTFPIKQWQSKDFQATMIELIRRAGLTYSKLFVFSRCVTCNDVLVPVPKPAVQDRVEPKIYSMYKEFTECPTCRKVFWGFDGEQVINYKSFRTLERLRSLCLAADAPLDVEDTKLAVLRSFRSFPRRVKTVIFMFLEDADLQTVLEVFPVFTDLVAEVRESRRTGVPVPAFRVIKNC